MVVGTKGKAVKWGDDEDDDLDTDFETPVDANGIKERTRVTTNSKGQKVKTVTRIKVREVKIRVPKGVAARKSLPRFGDAVEGEVNVTLLSRDFVGIEHPDDQMGDEGNDPGLSGTLGDFMAKLEQRRMEREMDIDEPEDSTRAADASKGDGDDGDKSGKYVPPGQRGMTGGARTLDSVFAGKSMGENDNTLRVSNLSKSITEDDLRDLFARFGRISRVSLPRGPDREPRGFAYVSFFDRKDADFALEKLQSYGYDHLILKLEWAKPPKDPSQEQTVFRSGYGQQLAQDTKEKVSYASNLTGNR